MVVTMWIASAASIIREKSLRAFGTGTKLQSRSPMSVFKTRGTAVQAANVKSASSEAESIPPPMLIARKLVMK